MQRIAVLGGGFAGLWSALGAARKLDEARIAPETIEVVLVNPHPHHRIRVRNYEADLAQTLVPLADVLDPVGVRLIQGAAVDLDVGRRIVAVRGPHGDLELAYDRLILATGSRLVRPPIPGLAEFAFDVDTYEGARRLQDHIDGLPGAAPGQGRFTALVVGAGLTGVEIAAELPQRLRHAAQASGDAAAAARTVLADRAPRIADGMGGAQPVIEGALQQLGVEPLAGVTLQSIDATGAVLGNGERVAASTVIWCAGMHADSLNARVPVEADNLGRLPVDPYMRVKGVAGVFAAGDAAHALIDGAHASVMSCQHARPMGRFAGHNAVCDLLGLAMLPVHIDWYTTILDLGPWGAVYTEGWERRLAAQGALAKRTKQIINHERIYPPRTRDKKAILAAAAPTVQAPPPVFNEPSV